VSWITTIFGEQGHVDAAQECARAVVVFVYGLAALRLAGRRIFGKWSAFDIIVSMIVASALSRALTGGAALGGTLLATTLLLGLHWVLSRAAARWRPLSRLIEGRPVTLATDGRLDVGRMLPYGVTRADLDEGLRQAGVARIEDTATVTLEPSGKITVVKAQ
jgi:uncharacterized membrane protein YcaP (DUF421 family)